MPADGQIRFTMPVRPAPDPGPDPDTRAYDALLAEARTIYPGVAVGRPGRSRSYWPTIAALRALRLRWAVDLEGADHVAPGPAILIGNHVHFLDPVCVVMTRWWRVSAFTKFDWFDHPIGPFFRLMGQIPLRRGDPASTEWAMQMSRHALRDGRAHRDLPRGHPDPGPRPAAQAAQADPGPAPAGQPGRARPRGRDEVHPPPAAPPDPRHGPGLGRACRWTPRTLSPDELIDRIRDALLDLGGQTYVDRYAQEVKAERQGTGRR